MSVEPRIAPGSCPLCPLDQGDTMGGAESKPYPFSTCFASPFMPLHPTVYARMLGEKMRRHNARVWLINTGWTGGAPGTGKRIPLPLTRRMVDAALHGELDAAATRRDRSSDSKFRARSKVCRRRSPSCARPGATRTPTITPPGKLADMFVENFLQFAEEAGSEIAAASPRGAENR